MTKTNIIGVYDDEDLIVDAIHHIQKKDIKIKDVLTPIPIHGVFEALKLETRLPIATFLYGVLGTTLTFAFLYWTSVVSYPLKFGGKPLNSLSLELTDGPAPMVTAFALPKKTTANPDNNKLPK